MDIFVTGAMELYPRDNEDMRVVLETGHARRKTSATGVTRLHRSSDFASGPFLPSGSLFP